MKKALKTKIKSDSQLTLFSPFALLQQFSFWDNLLATDTPQLNTLRSSLTWI